ncbi:MAG: DUF2802 domain-containing protein [Gammaproteobacteria bacterium]
MNNLILVFLIVLLPSVIAAGIYVMMKMFRTIQNLEYEMRLQKQRASEIEHSFSALCNASTGEGSHIARLEQRVRGLSDRQDTLDLRTQHDLPYSKAGQLAQDGASIDELVLACGLTRAEAELVIMLHGPYGQG